MKQHIVLVIDTIGERGLVTVKVGARSFIRAWRARGRVEQLLAKINAVLGSARVPLNAVTEITVNPGPGSFIGARVGVAVANTLGWALGAPVNGKRPPVAVKYSR